jgi:dolichol kinase
VIGVAVGALVLFAEVWRRAGGAAPEKTRKLIHLGGGLVCLSFPFLIESPLVVLGMALGLSGFFTLGAKFRILHSLHDVERKTRGSEYYPLAVFMVFLVAGTHRWIYVAAILVLAVADAFAALIGTRYGRLRYEVEENSKSVEGSLAFLAIAFLAIALPGLFMSGLPPAVVVPAAVLVGLLVTGFEAVSLRGSDNLFVPLGVCVVLAKITTKPVGEIRYQLFSLLAIAVVMGLLGKIRRSFNAGGSVVVALFAYGAWALGSETWALPVFAAFALQVSLGGVREGDEASCDRGKARVQTAFRGLLVPLLSLVVGNTLNVERWTYPVFLTAIAGVASFGIRARWPHWWTGAVGGSALSWALVVAAAWFATGGPATPTPLVIGAVVLAAGTANHFLAQRESVAEGPWTAARFGLVILAALVVLVLMLFGLMPPWCPR